MGILMDHLADPRLDRRAIDEISKEAARHRNRDDHEIGQLLVVAQDLEVETLYGFTFREWAARRFGFSGAFVEDRLRTARRLEELPALGTCSREGEVVYSVVREIARVADPETEGEWIAAGRGKTAHEMQRLVSGHVRGDSPTTLKKPEAEVRRVTHQLDAGAYALLQEARRVAVKAAGESLDASAFFATLCRAYLAVQSGGEKSDAGRSSYQVALVQCEDCGNAELAAGGDPVTATANDVARAECDAVRLGRVDGAEAPRATQDIPPKTRRMVSARQNACCAVPGCTNSVFLDIHHVDLRSEGGTHDPERLVMLCEHHHRTAHSCALLIDGTYREGFTFRHADGTEYGSTEVDGGVSDVMTRSFEALTGMGYQHREARGLLDRVRAQVCATSTRETVVRAALKAAPGVREAVAVYRRCA